MADIVNIGTTANDGTGDKLRTAFTKINAAFALAKDNLIDYRDWEDTTKGTVVGSQVRLAVPSQHATINAAIAYLNTRRIAEGTTVVIKVADGTYVLSTSLLFTHIDGARIQLIGNATTPTNCVITVTGAPGFDAVICSGSTLGYINGFYFTLDAKATSANNATAILSVSGSKVYCGPNIVVDNWYYGIAARDHSYIRADYAIVSTAGDVGIWAFNGSYAECNYAIVTNCSDGPNLGYGIQAEYGSSVECSYANCSGNLIAGIAALSNSSVRAHYAVSSSNLGSGFLARDGGSIENHNATASTNTVYGQERINTGHIAGNSVTMSGNGVADNNRWVECQNDIGARLYAHGGTGTEDLRIDSSGTGSVFFNTGGGAQFQIANTASAVNFLRVQGSATGNSVQVNVNGSDTNASLAIAARGTGDLSLVNNRTNYLRAVGGNTGFNVALAAEGADTNIGLQLQGKGTGIVFLGASQANYCTLSGAPTSSTPVFASAGSDTNIGLHMRGKGTGSVFMGSNQANYVRANGAAASNTPALYAEGSDTNIDLLLSGKGTGIVRFGTWTSNAAAAVNGYITVKDSSGNVRKLATIV